MANKFNWDQWTNFDDYRIDDDGNCDIISTTPETTSTSGTSGTSGTPEIIIKCPPRIETFNLYNTLDTDLIIGSGYLC
jgi:hypothetical protein